MITTPSWTQRLAQQFASAFDTEPVAWRTLGREGEHPIVHRDGTAADVGLLWDELAQTGDYKVLREGDLVVGLEADDLMFSAEVGKGTLEIIVGPEDDLHALRATYERAMERLVSVTDRHNLAVLGFGIQPVTPATFDLMTAKQRYRVLLDVIGEPWLWFSLTASDQVHIDVARAGVLQASNVANVLAPLTVGLCANSSVMGGALAPAFSAREAGMGGIQREGYRHGMPAAASDTFDAWIGRTMGLDYLMHVDAQGANHPYRGSFQSWLDAQDGLSDEDAFTAWLHHEHYIWNSARPRTAHATVELRAACQQPWPEHMAASALGAGLVCGHASIANFLAEQLGDDLWSASHAWHKRVLVEGLGAEEPTSGLVVGVLERAKDALAARGRGEEVYLEPLFARWQARQNPGQLAQAIFQEGGVKALVEHTCVR